MPRTIILNCALLLAIFVGCGEEDLGQGFVVSAPDTYVGATVFLDGRPLGTFQHLETHGTLYESILKRIFGDSPAFHVVMLSIDLSNVALQPGEHQLRVEKPGLPSASGTFRYPFVGAFRSFFVDGSKIELLDEAPANSR